MASMADSTTLAGGVAKALPRAGTALRFSGVSVQFTVLGSGSSGNCAYLETGSTRLLVDAGLSGRQIRLRLAGLQRSVEGLGGILLTHEHQDHTQGIVGLCAKHDIPIYCNRLTKEALERQFEKRYACRIFATGAAFEIGEVTVETFPVPHDAEDPVGFLLRTSAGSVGVLTDLGHATKLVLERVRAAQVLMLEANHDVKLLQDDTKRPWSVKQRILSRHGHLSNDAAAEAAEQLAEGSLRHLFLGHLSRDCNRPELALGTVTQRLLRAGIGHIQVEATSQEAPNPTVPLGAVSTPSAPTLVQTVTSVEARP